MQETCHKLPNNESTEKNTPKLQLIKAVPKGRKRYKRDIRKLWVMPLCDITRKPLGLCDITQVRKNLTKKNENLLCDRIKYVDELDENIRNSSGQPASGEDDMFFQSKNLKLKTLDYISPDDPIRRRNFYSYVKKYNKRHPNGSAFDDVLKFMETLCSTHSKASLASVTTVLLRVIRLQLGNLANKEHNRQLLQGLRTRYKVPNKYITKRALTLTEVRKLVAEAKPKASALSEFLFHTSFRIGDAYKIELNNCRELDNGNWLVRTTQKGQKKNEIEVRKAVFMRVYNVFQGKKYIFECKKTGKAYTHSGIRLLFTKEARRILGGKISTHDMRRAFATNMIKLKFSPKEIMIRMGIKAFDIFLGRYVDQDGVPVEDIPCVSRHDKASLIESIPSLSEESDQSIPIPIRNGTALVECIPAINQDKRSLEHSNKINSITVLAQKNHKKIITEPSSQVHANLLENLSVKEKRQLEELRKLRNRIDNARKQVSRMPLYAAAAAF